MAQNEHIPWNKTAPTQGWAGHGPVPAAHLPPPPRAACVPGNRSHLNIFYPQTPPSPPEHGCTDKLGSALLGTEGVKLVGPPENLAIRSHNLPFLPGAQSRSPQVFLSPLHTWSTSQVPSLERLEVTQVTFMGALFSARTPGRQRLREAARSTPPPVR